MIKKKKWKNDLAEICSNDDKCRFWSTRHTECTRLYNADWFHSEHAHSSRYTAWKSQKKTRGFYTHTQATLFCCVVEEHRNRFEALHYINTIVSHPHQTRRARPELLASAEGNGKYIFNKMLVELEQSGLCKRLIIWILNLNSES